MFFLNIKLFDCTNTAGCNHNSEYKMVGLNRHNNMIVGLSYNWQILEQPLTEQEIEERVENNMPMPEDSFTSQESANLSLAPTVLKCPSFGFLFCYRVEWSQTNHTEIELQPEVMMFEEPVRLGIERKTNNKTWIYLQLEIENSEVYDTPLVLTVRIRCHTEPKLPEVTSIAQLVRMAGHRQINLYTASTYATLKRDLLVESPVVAEWKQSSNSFVGLKLMRPEEQNDWVDILWVEVMNWLSVHEDIRKLSVRNLLRRQFRLRAKEVYNVLFSCDGSLIGEQIPFSILYRLKDHSKVFKMVKQVELYDCQ